MNFQNSPIRANTSVPVSVEIGSFSKSPEALESPAVIINIDGSNNMGALSYEAGLNIAKAAEIALEKSLPIVAFISSSGADIKEGISAVHGWGIAAKKLVECSGIVPMIFTIVGPAVSGPALLLGISDISIMTQNSYAFVTGPTMVRAFTGVNVSNEDLGGYEAHDLKSGVANFVVPDLESARQLVSDLLSLIPPNTDTLPRRLHTDDHPDRAVPEALDMLPENSQGGYDVRGILRTIADDGEILESKPNWAANIITALATIDGHPLGIIANQPQVLAGTLDIAASQKAAHFVNFLDAFNLPILTFVDTPGFQPGRDLEWRGMIRHGAQLAFAYASASVPRICITLRKSYGGAYIVMDSKKIGNDLSIAWPSAEIAVMGSKGAVEVLHRNIDSEKRQQLENSYIEQHLNPYKAAERGSIDAVIDPKDTRSYISSALKILSSKKEGFSNPKHSNTPL